MLENFVFVMLRPVFVVDAETCGVGACSILLADADVLV